MDRESGSCHQPGGEDCRKSGRGLTRLELVQTKEKRRRPGVVLGELQEEGHPAADSQHWTLPLAVRAGERFPAQGVPSLSTECGLQVFLCAVAVGDCCLAEWKRRIARAGKLQSVEDTKPPCLADCAVVSGSTTSMGANIAVGSSPSFPPDTRGTPTKYCIYCT